MLKIADLRKIEPKRGRATKVIPDGKVGGLSARIGARGQIEFSLVYRWNGNPWPQLRRSLGYWWDDERGPAPSDRWITLDQARIKAMLMKEKARMGDPDLAYDWTAPPPAKPEKPKDAVEAVIDRYAREHLKTLRTGAEFEKLLRQSLSAVLDRPISEVTRADIRKVLDGHMARGKGFMANRVFSALATFFIWAADRDLVPASPMAGMKRPMRKEASRDRVLNDQELAMIWNAVGTLHAPRRDTIRLMMLTGLRVSEASEIRWADIADGTLTIPAERAKNGMAHLVPLSPAALAVINARERASDRVFDFNGKRADLSTIVANLAKEMDIPNWRTHDLRRSFASGLQRLGVKPEVIDRCLNHSAVIKGVAAVYLREAYLPERRAAMEKWGAHVASIVG